MKHPKFVEIKTLAQATGLKTVEKTLTSPRTGNDYTAEIAPSAQVIIIGSPEKRENSETGEISWHYDCYLMASDMGFTVSVPNHLAGAKAMTSAELVNLRGGTIPGSTTRVWFKADEIRPVQHEGGK